LSTNAGGVFTGVAPPTRQKVNLQMLYAKAKPHIKQIGTHRMKAADAIWNLETARKVAKARVAYLSDQSPSTWRSF
jgi:hypothetical protein